MSRSGVVPTFLLSAFSLSSEHPHRCVSAITQALRQKTPCYLISSARASCRARASAGSQSHESFGLGSGSGEGPGSDSSMEASYPDGTAIIRVLLFVPNLVDYARAALTLLAFIAVPEQSAGLFTSLYLLNFALDGVDGVLARRLNQKSTFGAFLDVAIDNSLRALMWARAAQGQWWGSLAPCVEWLVFACTHSQALAALGPLSQEEADNPSPKQQLRAAVGDWKDTFGEASYPAWVRTVMSNGFKNPFGALAIAGIHFLPLWLWLHLYHSPGLPLLGNRLLGLPLLIGRLMAACVELWVLTGHLLKLLCRDATEAAVGLGRLKRK